MVELTLASISEYLTEGLIEEAFKQKTKSNDSVKSIHVSRAAPAGEGLLSAVYRIRISGFKYCTAFVAKGLVNDLLLRNSLDCAKYFKREAVFFSKVLPTLIDIQNSLGAKESIKNCAPICYGYHLDGVSDYILMEDLCEKGFKSISEKPTVYERDMTLKTLAHFHAVSLALRLKKPNEFNRIANLLPELYYNEENRDWYSQFLQRGIAINKEVLSQYEDLSSIYYHKFEELVSKDVYGKLIEVLTTWGAHPVFNHGDAWCPNFLCSNKSAVAIDFQLFRCASPATDLAFFLFLCSNACNNKDDFMKGVEIYYNALEYYITDMGIDAHESLTRADLYDELKKHGKFGILACLTTIPLLASKRCDVLNSFESKFIGIEKIALEDLWKLTPITNEEHKLRLVNAVRVAVDMGLI